MSLSAKLYIICIYIYINVKIYACETKKRSIKHLQWLGEALVGLNDGGSYEVAIPSFASIFSVLARTDHTGAAGGYVHGRLRFTSTHHVPGDASRFALWVRGTKTRECTKHCNVVLSSAFHSPMNPTCHSILLASERSNHLVTAANQRETPLNSLQQLKGIDYRKFNRDPVNS